MIKNIINTFEEKFNNYAKTTSAFSSRFISDEDSAIGTLCFNEFNVEFEYCLDRNYSVKSELCIILDFSKKSSSPLMCMMYDIIPLLNSFTPDCWFYPFIENEKRMELCFDKLSKDFNNVLPLIKEFVLKPDAIKILTDTINKNIENYSGFDIIKESENIYKDLDEISENYAREYLLNMYIEIEQTIFSTYEYRDFLEGDYKKALRKYKKKKHRIQYEDLLIDYIENAQKPKEILTKKYRCLQDGLKEQEGSDGFLPFCVSTFIAFIPIFLLFTSLYFIICTILYSECIYATQFTNANFMSTFLPAFISSIAMGYFMQETVYKLFFRKKYRRAMEYSAILETEKTKKRMRVFTYVVYILAIVFVFLGANNGFVFTDLGMKDSSYYFSISGTYHSYNSFQNVTVDDDKITAFFDDGTYAELDIFITNDDFENNIRPILTEQDITIIYK